MKDQQNPYIAIAGTIGALTIGMIAVVLIFARDAAWTVAIIAPCMAFLGVMLGYFASKKK